VDVNSKMRHVYEQIAGPYRVLHPTTDQKTFVVLSVDTNGGC